MGKIYYIMGKSASGKDTIYKRLRERFPNFHTVILYTTRPARSGEQDGVEYYFTTDSRLLLLEQKRKVIEKRTYQTLYGPWSYATVDDGQIDLTCNDYLMMGTLESYKSLKAYFGAEKLVPFYLEVEDGERLTRALLREKQQKQPKYSELCRRFLADEADFSEERLREAGIKKRFNNIDQTDCIGKILSEIKQ